MHSWIFEGLRPARMRWAGDWEAWVVWARWVSGMLDGEMGVVRGRERRERREGWTYECFGGGEPDAILVHACYDDGLSGYSRCECFGDLEG